MPSGFECIRAMVKSLLKKAWAKRRDVAGASLYWSGLSHGYQALARPGGAIILMYHSIAPDELAGVIDPPNRMSPADFERQMRFLHDHRRVVSMTQLAEQLEAGQTPEGGTVCITFDDGYLDNLTTAAPILDKYKLPATLFLPTAYIDRAENQWADVLHVMFTRRTLDRLRLPELNIDADISRDSELKAARLAIHIHLLQSEYGVRSELLQEVERQLKPAGEPMPRLTMNWDDVRELVRRHPRFEIGGHSRHHIDLRTHGGAFAESEIRGCREDLDRELGPGARHFSFPYGRWRDETRNIASTSGWRCAIGASPDVRIKPSNDRFVLGRPPTPESMTALRFSTSGAYPNALKLVGLRP
jgi:peptidoglycan/xylan/chitin deacetylase (PgdA/CDA1 family)